MKANELRQKSVEELSGELNSLLREQFNLRMQAGTGQLGKPAHVKKVRREIARIRTVMNEKARAGDAS